MVKLQAEARIQLVTPHVTNWTSIQIVTSPKVMLHFFLGNKSFLFVKIESFMIYDFVKPHKISAFYLD